MLAKSMPLLFQMQGIGTCQWLPSATRQSGDPTGSVPFGIGWLSDVVLNKKYLPP